jgi:ADP-ribose pyrophosphatase
VADASDRHLAETAISRQEVFKGRFLHVVREHVRLPDDSTATREFVLHPGAVAVVPILDDGRVVMERQWRHPVGRVIVEFPAGKIDAGEERLACAKRELQEETGYSAREWAFAGQLHPVVAYSDEFIDVWFARGLTLGRRNLDAGEFLDVIAVEPAQLLEWCRTGVVSDAKTLMGTLWLQNVLAGTWKLDWRP